MNEGKKTGLFWIAAAVVAGAAAIVAWPSTSTQDDVVAGRMLFDKFVDPLAAASMKITTFDEAQGTLEQFEVRKDATTGLWTIPSRDGYPADAIEQMKDAANSLVGVKILDIQTSNAEDHDDLGVAEPKLEDLKVGDEGVGRLVTFKNESQETLASLIIGDSVKGDPAKRYVRIPNQDPVYVVTLDESPLTTNFRDWIEDDLLQLSSIDIDSLEIKDYTATLGQRGISLTRKYTAELKQDGTDWLLAELLDFDPKDPRVEPTKVQMTPEESLNTAKLNDLKNALDDLKIVNVYRKPEGVSATLKASADLLSDEDAITSLAQRGFYPIEAGVDGEAEILSANGELSVSLKDGVKYLIRFGNIAGVEESDASEESEEGEEKEGGVNRFLFVTTMVDESKFPVPALKEIPQTVEELDAMLNPPKVDEPAKEAEEEKPAEEAPAEETKTEEPEMKEDAIEEVTEEGETEVSGEGEATGEGQAQAEDATAAEEEPADDEEITDEKLADEKLTDEEMQERLEAEQEIITKENQRLLDARKDQLDAAARKVRELNERFADWYYVIPESTYSKLRIGRDELLADPAESTTATPPAGGPQFNLPNTQGFPGN